jgi:UDP-N-acetylmuramoyl-L-alanyl-D-glutamate--2,6-diaminopimelate ligase
MSGERHDIHLPLVGSFQAMNVACALGLVVACGGPAGPAFGALSGLVGIPGRMELVARRANGAAVFVDYAHTPDALANVLAALRPHTEGRLAVVFGCGGDRDAGKRPEMGAIAAKSADRIIVTDDNPRSESPAAIRAAIMAGTVGAAELMEIGDRRDAIRAALAALAPGDVALIAGKGHERGQIVGEEILPFVDADEVRAALSDIEGQT